MKKWDSEQNVVFNQPQFVVSYIECCRRSVPAFRIKKERSLTACEYQ